TQTDAGGSFRIANVPAGTVLVIASATRFGSKSSVVVLQGGHTATVNLALGTSTGRGAGGTGNSRPVILSTHPTDGATHVHPATPATTVDPSSRIIFAFDAEMLDNTLTITGRNGLASKISPPALNASGFSIRKATDVSIANAYEYIPGPSVAPFQSFTTYTVF